jgi:hypothetical protein
MTTFWSGFWSASKQHSEDAYWIADEVESCAELPDMPTVDIALEDVSQAIRKTQNWKAQGADGIHNFWWKYFKCTHEALVQHFQQILQDPTLMPRFLTVGVTCLQHMLPKSRPALDPKIIGQ